MVAVHIPGRVSARLDVVLRQIARKVLRRYQIGWHSDNPFIAQNGGRQIGKDHKWSFDMALEMRSRGGVQWNGVSATSRTAAQLLHDVSTHYRFICACTEAAGFTSPKRLKSSVTQILLDNESSMESHAATVRAVVGRRGSFFFNEAGVIPKAEQLYEAAMPIVTGQLDMGMSKARLVIVSNASPKGNWWHGFWTGRKSRQFHKITSTWKQCYTDWLDELGWNQKNIKRWINNRIRQRVFMLGKAAYDQWYNCIFRAPQEGGLPPELLDRQSQIDPLVLLGRQLYGRTLHQVVGYDVGRHNHPAVVMPAALFEEAGYQLGHETRQMWQTPFHTQLEVVKEVVTRRQTDRLIVDAGGMGDPQAEACARAWPHLTESYKFGPTTWWPMFANFKSLLEEGRFWLDPGDLDTRMELDGVMIEQKNGRDRVIMPETKGGAGEQPTHGDRATAAMMCGWGMRSLASSSSQGYDALDIDVGAGPLTKGIVDWSRLGGKSNKGW